MAFGFEPAYLDGPAVVSAWGELDATSRGDLRARLLDAAEGSRDRVVIDLLRVTYIESSPLGTLVEISALLASKGGGLAIVCPTGEVFRVLRLAGLHKLLDVFDDVPAAVTHLGIGRRESD